MSKKTATSPEERMFSGITEYRSLINKIGIFGIVPALLISVFFAGCQKSSAPVEHTTAAPAPIFTPSSGILHTYGNTVSIRLSAQDSEAEIRYEMSMYGDPLNGTVYDSSSPIVLNVMYDDEYVMYPDGTWIYDTLSDCWIEPAASPDSTFTVIRAVSIVQDSIISPVTEASYRIIRHPAPLEVTVSPVITVTGGIPDGSSYLNTATVTLSVSDEEASIIYTLDGSDPSDTSNSARLNATGPIKLTETTTILACAIAPNKTFSTSEEKTITIDRFRAPRDLHAARPVSGGVYLRWIDESDGEDGYAVLRRRAGTTGPFTEVALLPANSVSWNDSEPSTGSSWDYRVETVRKSYRSAASTFRISPLPDPSGWNVKAPNVDSLFETYAVSALYGNYAYVAGTDPSADPGAIISDASLDGFRIYDLSTAGEPKLLGFVKTGVRLTAIAAVEGRLAVSAVYKADAAFTGKSYDIGAVSGTPSNPIPLADLPCDMRRMAIAGNILWYATWDKGLGAVNLDTGVTVKETGYDFADDLVIRGKRLYTLTEGMNVEIITCWDLTDPALRKDPVEYTASSEEDNNWGYLIAATGSGMVLCTHPNSTGQSIIDWRDRTSPTPVSSVLDVGSFDGAMNAVGASETAFFFATDRELYTVDARPGSGHTIVDHRKIPNYAGIPGYWPLKTAYMDISVSSSRILRSVYYPYTNSYSGFVSFELETDNTLVYSGGLGFSGIPLDVAEGDDGTFYVSGNTGIKMYRRDTAGMPRIANILHAPLIYRLVESEGYLYAGVNPADRYISMLEKPKVPAIMVYDLANPLLPEPVCTVNLSEEYEWDYCFVDDILIEGNRLYVSVDSFAWIDEGNQKVGNGDAAGLYTLDISNPRSPVIIGHDQGLDKNSSGGIIHVSGDKLRIEGYLWDINGTGAPVALAEEYPDGNAMHNGDSVLSSMWDGETGTYPYNRLTIVHTPDGSITTVLDPATGSKSINGHTQSRPPFFIWTLSNDTGQQFLITDLESFPTGNLADFTIPWLYNDVQVLPYGTMRLLRSSAVFLGNMEGISFIDYE